MHVSSNEQSLWEAPTAFGDGLLWPLESVTQGHWRISRAHFLVAKCIAVFQS